MKKYESRRFYGPNDIKIGEIKVPDIKPKWVLIKVRATEICGGDLHFYREKTSIPITSEVGTGKFVPGHEVAVKSIILVQTLKI